MKNPYRVSQCLRFIFVFLGIAFIVLVVPACGGTGTDSTENSADNEEPSEDETGMFTVRSDAFEDGEEIPLENACSAADVGGGNNQFHLAWENPPAATMSLAVTIVDEDAGNFTHLIMFNINNTVTTVGGGANPPSGSMFSPNDSGQESYFGPCPSEGQTHTYKTTVWALDVEDLKTEVSDSSDQDAVLTAIGEHAIDSAVLFGEFTNN